MEAADEFGSAGVAGDDGGFAAFGDAEGFFAEEHAETAALLHTAVAADAMLVKNRLYFGTEIHLFTGAAPSEPGGGEGYEGQAGGNPASGANGHCHDEWPWKHFFDERI